MSELQGWRLPRLSDFLIDLERQVENDDYVRRRGRLIQETLESFGIPVVFEGAYKGAKITQYLLKLGYKKRIVKGEAKLAKTQLQKISALADDIAMAVAAPKVYIETPISGTNYIGIGIPNQKNNIIGLKELMESDIFQQMKGPLRIALGEDIRGQPIVDNLIRTRHLLIAGATGTGKSTLINSIISCLLLTHTPDTLRFLIADLKMVELILYNGVPHLLSTVVTEIDKTVGALFWAVKEMERRYAVCVKAGTRDLLRYNEYLTKRAEKPLPYIVIIVDEIADLMMAAPEEVEKHICRLAQMGHQVGIHLIISTRHISTNVMTKQIKTSFPARIAFAVTNQADSRLILDAVGAERLFSYGDMLFRSSTENSLERIHGAYISDQEAEMVVRYWKGVYANDELYAAAVRIVQEAKRGSISLLQRKLQIGYSRAARLIEQLERAGVVGPDQGNGQGRSLLIGGSQNEPKLQLLKSPSMKEPVTQRAEVKHTYGKGKRWALLVGVNSYEDRMNYGQLQVCAKDAIALRDNLLSGGFDSDRVHLLTDDVGERPTRNTILATLKAIASNSAPDDVLLFYYSGHGDAKNGESYLVAIDGRRLVLEDTGVSISRIKSILEEAPARAKVIILDACHSGANIGGKGSTPMSFEFIQRVFEEAEGMAILASCKQGELSYEWPSEQRSVFTHFLLAALEGQADLDNKGFVTVQDANRYIVDGVKLWASQHHVNQTPTLNYTVAGDIVLVKNST